ncbi:MAG: hypothetical protein U0414_13700 [Polyangiaceae bacterium]
MKPRRIVCAGLSVIAVGCGQPEAASPSASGAAATAKPTPTAPAPPATTAPVPASSPAPSASADAEAPYRCAKDADCYVSCRQGAVNRAWYDAAKLPECKDGCQQGTTKVKCEANVCVAYAGDKRDDNCTHRPIQRD